MLACRRWLAEVGVVFERLSSGYEKLECFLGGGNNFCGHEGVGAC